MKRFPPLILGVLFSLTTLRAETVSDLKSWTLEGGVQMDPSKPGPDGKPSIKLDPKSRAALKLREADGSGKLSFSVYDDGTVASPDKQKAVGPRWGSSEANGRVFVGAIMYAPYLQPEGSYCLIDTDPKAGDEWNALKFLSPRGSTGWRKWEFDFHPDTGLAISVDGKPVPSRYFSWNSSQASAFNGLVLYGDDSPGAAAANHLDFRYQLRTGPADECEAGLSPPPPPPQAKGRLRRKKPKKIQRTAGNREAGRLCAQGHFWLEDLKNLTVPLVEGYATQHPRLLFFAKDKEDLQKARHRATRPLE